MNAREKVWRTGLLLLALSGSCSAIAGPAGLEEAAPDQAETSAGEAVLVDVVGNDAGVGPNRRLVTVLPPGHGRTRVQRRRGT